MKAKLTEAQKILLTSLAFVDRVIRNHKGQGVKTKTHLEPYLLKHGRWFQPALELRSDIDSGPFRECFSNAGRNVSAMRPDLFYVEGYAWSSVLPVHHAWLSDAEGNAYEPTWRIFGAHNLPEHPWAYLGIAMSTEWLYKRWTETKRWCIFDDNAARRKQVFDTDPGTFFAPLLMTGESYEQARVGLSARARSKIIRDLKISGIVSE